MTEGIPSGGETTTGVAETTTAEVSEAVTAVPENCTQQFVLTVASKPRFLSNRLKEDRFTAETAFQNTGSSEPIKF
jgi:hypothetical protein